MYVLVRESVPTWQPAYQSQYKALYAPLLSDTLSQCWLDAAMTSRKAAQHSIDIGSKLRDRRPDSYFMVYDMKKCPESFFFNYTNAAGVQLTL